MTNEQQDRWNRIRHFPIDAPSASTPFSVRLAREQGWTPTYAARVIAEYRRFAFLAVAAGHGVTPSKAVDEAWHLHLLYTRNYWEEFCPQALGRPLHHNPSGGGVDDEAKYEGWYDDTLASYERLFGEAPPADVWPRGTELVTRSKRVWPFLGLFAAVLAGCEEPSNPLDWHGPAFLGLFAGVYGFALLVAFLVRRGLAHPAEGPPAEEWGLHVYDLAYLNGDSRLCLATALAQLTASGALSVDRSTGRMRLTGPGVDARHPLERAIVQAVDSPTGARYEGIAGRAKPALDEIEGSLRRQGLWMRHEEAIPAALLPFAIATVPLLLGIAKISVGLSRERPVGFLVVGCIAGFLVNLFLLSPPRRSRYGDRVLEQLRRTNPTGSYEGSRNALPPDELASGIALYGLVALDGGDYAYLRTAIAPLPAASSGDGGASGCSASSCGGGGGGCGGGGCGGCGS